jgi:hypothetical protein
LTGVEGRPLIGTIIKPSIGLTPKQTADMVKTLGKQEFISLRMKNYFPLHQTLLLKKG